METIIAWDKYLFKFINSQWHNYFFDWLMPFLRNSIMWFPLYFFFILFITINYKKTGWWWLLFAAITVILSNYVSSDSIKENIIRLRPCNDPYNSKLGKGISRISTAKLKFYFIPCR